jgi:hypothetical protein
LKTRMRGAALVLVALSFAAGCEVAFPFDRYLIPEEAGAVAEADSGSFSEDSSLPSEDSGTASPRPVVPRRACRVTRARVSATGLGRRRRL